MQNIDPEQLSYDDLVRRRFMMPNTLTELPPPPVLPSSNVSNTNPPNVSGLTSTNPNNIPSPVEAKYTKTLSEQPQRGKHNIWRYIGAALAGFGPEGPQAGRAFLDTPYQRKMEDWRNKIAAIEPQLQLQLAKEKTGLDTAKLESLNDYRGIQEQINMLKAQTSQKAETNRENRTNIFGQDTASKILSRKLNDDLKNWRVKNPKLDDIQWAYSPTDPEEKNARLEFLQSVSSSKRESPEESAKKTSAKEQALIDTRYNNLPKLGSIAATTAGSRETSTLIAKANAPESPEEKDLVDSMVSKAAKNPDSAWDFAKLIPNSKTRAKYISRIVDQAPSKVLDTNERRVVDSAKTAIKHANKVKEYLKDPDIGKAIGPIAGRLTELGQVVGKSIYNEGPAARKEAEFLDLMKYLILFESSSVSGTRPSWQLINYLKSTQGAKFDLDKAYGNLDATIASAGIRLSGIYGASKEGQPIEDKKPGFKVRIIPENK